MAIPYDTVLAYRRMVGSKAIGVSVLNRRACGLDGKLLLAEFRLPGARVTGQSSDKIAVYQIVGAGP